MQWEKMTSDQLAAAVETSKKTVVVPVSIIEKHGHHLPLATDAMINRVILAEAEKMADFVVAPEVVFGQGCETKNGQGTIAIRSEVMMALLENICDELYRNGFEKIVIADGHGGNGRFLPYFAQDMMTKEKPYLIYYFNTWFITQEEEEYLNNKYGADDDLGHADRDETALVMAYDESLVRMDLYDPKEPHYFPGLEWMSDNGIFTPVNWTVSRNTHVTGRPDLATPELGKELTKIHARHLARQVRLIQADEQAMAGYRKLLRECRFHSEN